jgi:hypothetical protein
MFRYFSLFVWMFLLKVTSKSVFGLSQVKLINENLSTTYLSELFLNTQQRILYNRKLFFNTFSKCIHFLKKYEGAS